MANKFALSGHGIDVLYTIDPEPGFPALIYQGRERLPKLRAERDPHRSHRARAASSRWP